ncbi:hypothetical protein GCM10009654_45600 [Streptomyces hebeiensis]|uniref:Uncharacterized protein n=1 Tax=Streptomyces hebeiensis TaxID=229486 RepID=A0ABN1UZ09_9ACTN
MQRTGDRVEDALGRATELAALHTGVVLDAEAGEHRDFLSPQSFDAAVASDVGQPGLLGRDPRPAAHEETPDLLLKLHGLKARTPISVLGVPESAWQAFARRGKVRSNPRKFV